jgi:hypothetical protein
MASKWLAWHDVKGYDRKSWAWSTAQLFVPHHQWTFKIDPSGHGKVQLQVYDHQDRLYNHKYGTLEEAKTFAEQLVDKWRAQAVSAGRAWSFDDFPEHQRRGFTMRAPTTIKYHGQLYRRAELSYEDAAAFHQLSEPARRVDMNATKGNLAAALFACSDLCRKLKRIAQQYQLPRAVAGLDAASVELAGAPKQLDVGK